MWLNARCGRAGPVSEVLTVVVWILIFFLLDVFLALLLRACSCESTSHCVLDDWPRKCCSFVSRQSLSLAEFLQLPQVRPQTLGHQSGGRPPFFFNVQERGGGWGRVIVT